MEYTPDLLKLPWKIENTLFSGIGKGFLRTWSRISAAFRTKKCRPEGRLFL